MFSLVMVIFLLVFLLFYLIGRLQKRVDALEGAAKKQGISLVKKKVAKKKATKKKATKKK